MNKIKLADIVVDCNNEKLLSDFYASLLGWEKGEMFGHPTVISENGVVFLFVQDDDYTYVPPVWPEIEGAQQKQKHFDFLVSDLKGEVKRAEELGAKKADHQYGGDHFVTMIDPAGQPFCLCQA